MHRVVLDASALIAVIYSEKGADIVERYLSHAIISAVNMAEVASYMVMKGLDIQQTRSMLEDLSLEIAEYDQQQAFLTGALRGVIKTTGLSLADRACLSLAMEKKLSVLTADKIWAKLDLGVKIQLIR